MPLPIEDYALIGDCRTCALVGRNGSIDWLCVPRFDSPACFAGLLGTDRHGHWTLAPAEAVRKVTRQYRGDTLILETVFETDNGAVKVTDFMPTSTPEPSVIRLVEGLRGTVLMKMELVIRFDYGSVVPWVRQLKSGHGIRATAGLDTLYCRTPVPLAGYDLTTNAEFTVSEEQTVPFDLAWYRTHTAGKPSAEGDPSEDGRFRHMLDETQSWWQKWSDQCAYQGRWRREVIRSLITLKALTYAPSGGMVAAATTSLPEKLGGCRNWDYRYCWLRDAAFTLIALEFGGHADEAQAWREWLINAVAGSAKDMQIMYGLNGERRLLEQEISWLPGYEDSKPVRVGNAAYRQHQLDVYGELMGALYRARKIGMEASAEGWRVQCAILRFLEEDWRKPDEGIWEVRGPSRHFTHSKVMAWVAFDRAIRMVEEFGKEGPVEKWKAVRDEIAAEIHERGYNRRLKAFVQYYDSDLPDASLLMLPLVGFISARDEKMRGTVEFIERKLLRDGFVDRYICDSEVDGLPPGEGAFLLCTFWLADNLALQGRREEAHALFEKLLSLQNDVGLLSEEYDTEGRRLVGNFPQAFSHVGLINTVRMLESPPHTDSFA